MMTNNAEKGGSGLGDQAQMQHLKTFSTATSNSALESAWTYNYRGIYLANLVLTKVPDIDMDAGDKANIIAQAHFLRAYFYVQLVRLFGNIPLVEKPLEKGSYNKPQEKPEKIWNFILQEADSAAMNLSTNDQLSDSQLGKATKGAAETLKLYTYIWLEEWDKAEKLGDDIINGKYGQYSLAPDYNKIWTQEGEFGPGSIFEINYVNDPSKPGIGSVIPGQLASRATWGLEFDVPTQNLVDAFEKGDPRLKATVLFENEKLPEGVTSPSHFHSPTGMNNRKYWLPPSQRPPNLGGGNAGTNERVFRLAEVMLWDAEASVHNGDVGHATDLVNKVRKRARQSGGNTDMTILSPYKTVTLQDIYHEQRVETALGSHRHFYNLVRTGRAAKLLPNYKEGVNNYFPIPLNQIHLSNGELKQNPGYD
jgi:hypothetical protein